jgi:uncharacterized membrane protein YedE/YeeE
MKARDYAMYILGGIITVAFVIFFGLLVFNAIPETNKELLYLIVGSLISAFTTVVGYFYGSSAGSREKNEAINKLQETKQNG